MAIHDLSLAGALTRIEQLARLALTQYPVGASARVSLLHVSENATFRVDDAGAGGANAGEATSVLRVHRLGYHQPGAIESELAWMDALRTEAGVRTPTVLPASDGRRVVSVTDPTTGETRACVRFEFLSGSTPAGDDRESYTALGALSAAMHRHARSWASPAGFTRFRWDPATAFGPEHRWGRWQDAPGAGPAEREVLSRLEATLRQRLSAFGTEASRFGLVHADTRLANLLAGGDSLAIIDFDDCGYSWYLYDLATAFSFFEHEPNVPDLIDAWLLGYRRTIDLPDTDEKEIWTLIMFRRLLLVAWSGSHPVAEDAKRLGASYTIGSCSLAEAYLSRYT